MLSSRGGGGGEEEECRLHTCPEPRNKSQRDGNDRRVGEQYLNIVFPSMNHNLDRRGGKRGEKDFLGRCFKKNLESNRIDKIARRGT